MVIDKAFHLEILLCSFRIFGPMISQANSVILHMVWISENISKMKWDLAVVVYLL